MAIVSLHHTSRQKFWYSANSVEEKFQCATWNVETMSITSVRQKSQAWYWMTLRTCTTIYRWAEQFNNLETLKTELVEGGPQFTSRLCETVGSYLHQYPKKYLREAVADLRIPYLTINIIFKMLVHNFSYQIPALHHFQHQDYAQQAAFYQFRITNMSSESCILLRIISSDEYVLCVSEFSSTQIPRIYDTWYRREAHQHKMFSDWKTFWCAVRTMVW